MKDTKKNKGGFKIYWYDDENEPVKSNQSSLLTKDYRKRRTGDWWSTSSEGHKEIELDITWFFRPPPEKRFRHSKLGYVLDELNLANVTYYANNIDWAFWNYDTEKTCNTVNPMEFLSFQYPSHEHFVYESPRRVKRRYHHYRRRRWGRTTSAVADQDNSFYLWKWFMLPKTRIKKYWSDELTFDEQDEPHFFPLNHVIHIQQAELFTLSPRLVTVSQIYAVWLKNIIHRSLLGQHLFNIFPRADSTRAFESPYTKKFEKGIKRRLQVDWIRTPEMSRARRLRFLRFHRPAELLLSNDHNPHEFDNAYQQLGGIFGEVCDVTSHNKFISSVLIRNNPVEHLIDLFPNIVSDNLFAQTIKAMPRFAYKPTYWVREWSLPSKIVACKT